MKFGYRKGPIGIIYAFLILLTLSAIASAHWLRQSSGTLGIASGPNTGARLLIQLFENVGVSTSNRVVELLQKNTVF